MLIQNMTGAALFYHVAPRATQASFMMKILLSGNSEPVTQSI
jgi:hypothetical protein